MATRTAGEHRLGSRHMIECPNCKMIASAPDILGRWNGYAYTLTCCGKPAHLDMTSPGGARNWIEKPRRKPA